MQFALLILASFVAGAINSVAGGGTLLTFPSLLAMHVPSVVANATNTVALVPGSLSAYWGYRSTKYDPVSVLWFAIPSLLGGVLGALLLVRGGESLFRRLVPWLLFSAVGLFAAQEPVRRFIDRNKPPASSIEPAITLKHRLRTAVLQLLIAIYGGFFGAGMGILMLAAIGYMGLSDIHEMNRLKNISAVMINGVAAVTFALTGQVHWPLGLLMAVAAVGGGYLGAGIAQRVGQKWVRRFVITVGLGIGVLTLVRPL